MKPIQSNMEVCTHVDVVGGASASNVKLSDGNLLGASTSESIQSCEGSLVVRT
jgi:hypothetical protein